jgi:hypothetical protein
MSEIVPLVSQRLSADIWATVHLGGFPPKRTRQIRSKTLAVLMISDVGGQTPEGYDGLLGKVGPALKAAQGFVMHASHPIDGGWRVVEIWNSREDATRFYAATIAPHLPKGIHPKLTFEPLHDVLQP